MFEIDISKDIPAQFKALAEKMLNNTVLNAGEQSYRMAEIEFYLYAKGVQEDAYTHRNPRQLLNGCWYIHPKSDDRTGIEITIGDSKKEVYGGILIRALHNLNDDNNYIYGTASVVKTLREAAKATREEIEALPILNKDNTTLTLDRNPKPFEEEIFACPRQLEGSEKEKKEFADEPFRFFCLPNRKHVYKEKVIIPYLTSTLGKARVAEIFKDSVSLK